MDKPNRNKTITIKINGNEKAYIQEQLNKNDYDQPKKEEDRHVLSESAATKETSDESFEWILPSDEMKSIERESLFVQTKQKKNNRNERVFHRLFVSIVLAVLIGSGFWYIVIRTITASEAPNLNNAAPAVNTIDEGELNGGAEKIGLSPLELSFVQGGVFSNREAAETAKEEMIAKGFPAIVVSDEDKFYIALFVSDSLENAKAVATTYKDQGMDVYWKEITLTATTEAKLTDSDAKALTASLELYRLLIEASTQLRLSSEQFDSSKLAVTLNNMQALEVTNENIAKMVVSLKEAVAIAGTLGDSGQVSLQVQQHLLQFIAMYEQLV